MCFRQIISIVEQFDRGLAFKGLAVQSHMDVAVLRPFRREEFLCIQRLWLSRCGKS
jgi:hypothetical protein